MKIKEDLIAIPSLLATGVLATITMDIVALAAVKTRLIQLGTHQIIPNLLGRWVGSFARGKVFHLTIAETPPVAHEAIIGLITHYLIGITLTYLLVYPLVRILRRKISFPAALLYGIGTCVLPWSIMFPAMGFGFLGLKLPNPLTLVLFSALNHTAFGLGLFLWGNLINKPNASPNPVFPLSKFDHSVQIQRRTRIL